MKDFQNIVLFFQIMPLIFICFVYKITLHQTEMSLKYALTSPLSFKGKIQQIQYRLLMDTPKLKNQSLTHHLFYQNCLNEDKKLITDLPFFSKNLRKTAMRVYCPNLYIQKLRSIYYLLLHQTYQRKEKQFQRAFDLICLRFYENKDISDVKKKYLAEFLQFIEYESVKQGKVKQNLNKYPIMDEIFIDMIILEVQKSESRNKLETVSADDNYNIVNFLLRFDIVCQAKTLWQIRIENHEIKVNSSSIVITTFDREKDVENLSTGEISLEDGQQLDSSNVFSVSSNVFQNMQKSFIEMLNSFIKEDEKNEKSKQSEKSKLQSIFEIVEQQIEQAQKLTPVKLKKQNNMNMVNNVSFVKKTEDRIVIQPPKIVKKQTCTMHTTLNVINSPIKSPILKYKSNLKVTSPNNGSQKNIHTTPISNNKIIKPTMGTVKAINFVY